MKNKHYLEDAVAQLRVDGHLPERVLVLSDDDIVATTQSVYNVTQEIAEAKKVNMDLDLDDELLLAACLSAHRQNITFNEWMEQALELAIAESRSKPSQDDQ